MTREQAARIAEGELIWLEIDAELAYEEEVRQWLRGVGYDIPDPAAYGLTDEHGAKLSTEVVRTEAVQAAAWYDEASAAYEAVLKVA